MTSQLPGGITNSAVDGLGLFDNFYQPSDHEIEAEAHAKIFTGPYYKTLQELLHGCVATYLRTQDSVDANL